MKIAKEAKISTIPFEILNHLDENDSFKEKIKKTVISIQYDMNRIQFFQKVFKIMWKNRYLFRDDMELNSDDMNENSVNV